MKDERWLRNGQVDKLPKAQGSVKDAQVTREYAVHQVYVLRGVGSHLITTVAQASLSSVAAVVEQSK